MMSVKCCTNITVRQPTGISKFFGAYQRVMIALSSIIHAYRKVEIVFSCIIQEQLCELDIAISSRYGNRTMRNMQHTEPEGELNPGQSVKHCALLPSSFKTLVQYSGKNEVSASMILR